MKTGGEETGCIKNLLSSVFSSAWLCQQSSWYGTLSVVRPSVVCVTNISERNAQISFEFWLRLPWLGHTFFEFFKKNPTFSDVLRIFFVFINIGPYGSENLKTLLLQIAAESFQTFPEFSSQWSSQNYFGIFEILSLRFLMIFFSKISSSPLYPMEKPKISIILKMSDRRSKRSEIR